MLFHRPTVIVGLFLQQAVALFVLKSGAGFSLFNWIATLASDFLNQSGAGATFFFDAATVAKHWFFVNTVRISFSNSRRELLTPDIYL
jgi:CNT family concentrative nucleoside transporter